MFLRFPVLALALVALAGSAIPATGQPAARPDLADVIPALERNLNEAIVAFWYPRSIDREHGGYLVDFDATGRFKGEAPKMIVTQARMLWLSARLMRDGRGTPVIREAAETGYRFLVEKMWDHQHGGFFWEVDRRGTVVAPEKHLYGQAFGLYALSEYALATGRADVLAEATKHFDLLEAKSHDAVHGGYIEFFARDWTDPGAARPFLGGTSGLKLMNTHLHLMEALTTYYRASTSPLARRRLAELVAIQTNAVVRKDIGACTDQYRRDWTPVLDGDAARASYGHDLENIWLVVDALEALGEPVSPYVDLFRTLFAYSLKHGYDAAEGGFYDSGPLGAPADRRAKTWWVEAEVLVSALMMARLTGEARYADVFRKTWSFVNTKQTDWTNGEWWSTISPDGKASGDKAHRWKAGYHNGRAMVECIRLIKEMGGAK